MHTFWKRWGRRHMLRPACSAISIFVVAWCASQSEVAHAQSASPSPAALGSVRAAHVIGNDQGGLPPDLLGAADLFGGRVANIGDLDGDGIDEVAIQAEDDDDGATDNGAMYVLFLRSSGTVQSYQKISATEGGAEIDIRASGKFGFPGALDQPRGDQGHLKRLLGGTHAGDAMYVMRILPNATVVSTQKIAAGHGGMPSNSISSGDHFGHGLSGGIGDIDADGFNDMVVGAVERDAGGTNDGALYVLFMRGDDTVRTYNELTSGVGGAFDGILPTEELLLSYFIVAMSPRMDGNPVDLALSVHTDDGAILLLRLSTSGTVIPGSIEVVQDGAEGIPSGTIPTLTAFSFVGKCGDLDGDGIEDLLAGAPNDGAGGGQSGAVYIFYLNPANESDAVRDFTKLTRQTTGLTSVVPAGARFGYPVGVSGLGVDGRTNLLVGGRAGSGEAYVIFLGGTVPSPSPTPTPSISPSVTSSPSSSPTPSVSPTPSITPSVAPSAIFVSSNGQVSAWHEVSDTDGGFTGTLDDYDWFGGAIAVLGDLDKDGHTDIAVAAVGDDDKEDRAGALWILFMEEDQVTVKSHYKISGTQGGLNSTLIDDTYLFAESIAALPDMDADGTPELAVGVPGNDDGGTMFGALYILFLRPNGTVKSTSVISDSHGGFSGLLEELDYFGFGVATLQDWDNNGVVDIAVGAPRDDDGLGNGLRSERGAVYIIYLTSQGTVRTHTKLSATSGGITGEIDQNDNFGRSLATLPDMDADGVVELAVGARHDDDGGEDRGAVYILFMRVAGSVKSYQKISSTRGGFTGQLDDKDVFGHSLAVLPDLSNDGVPELAVSAVWDDDNGGAGNTSERGAIWILYLNSNGTVRSSAKISDSVGGFPPNKAHRYYQLGWGLAVISREYTGYAPILLAGAIGDDGNSVAQIKERGAVMFLELAADPSPTPSTTPSATPSTSGTPSSTATLSPTPSTTTTASLSPTPSNSPTPSSTVSTSPTSTASASSTPSAPPTPSVTSTTSASPTTTSTASATPSASLSPSSSPSPSKVPAVILPGRSATARVVIWAPPDSPFLLEAIPEARFIGDFPQALLEAAGLPLELASRIEAVVISTQDESATLGTNRRSVFFTVAPETADGEWTAAAIVSLLSERFAEQSLAETSESGVRITSTDISFSMEHGLTEPVRCGCHSEVPWGVEDGSGGSTCPAEPEADTLSINIASIVAAALTALAIPVLWYLGHLDLTGAWTLIGFTLQIVDVLSDVGLFLELWTEVFCDNELLAYTSGLSLVLTGAANLVCCALVLWRVRSRNEDTARYFTTNAAALSGISLLSISGVSVLEVLISDLFGMDVLSLFQGREDDRTYVRYQIRYFGVPQLIIEDVTQLSIQIVLLVRTDGAPSLAVLLAVISSISSVLRLAFQVFYSYMGEGGQPDNAAPVPNGRAVADAGAGAGAGAGGAAGGGNASPGGRQSASLTGSRSSVRPASASAVAVGPTTGHVNPAAIA